MRWLLTLLLLVAVALDARAGLILEGATDSLEVVTSAAGSIDFQASWSNVTAIALTTPGTTKGNISTATTTPMIGAPAAANFRHVRGLWLRNASATVANTVTIQMDVSATDRTVFSTTLAQAESLVLDETGNVTVFNSSGQAKVHSPETGIAGRQLAYNKNGTAKDATSYAIWQGKDGGFPGAWAIQDPGNLTGFATDCGIASQTTSPLGAAQMGSHFFQDAGTGSMYVAAANVASSVAELVQVIDIIGYVNCDLNNGAAGANCLTTVGAQTLTFTLVGRDLNGATNGRGVGVALLAGAALGNAAAISNTTITYTDQDGNSPNTATLQATVGWQMPATPVVGTFVPMTLAAGDNGVRSIQTLTNGTSYVSGNLLIVLYRVLSTLTNPVANVGATSFNPPNFELPGVRVYDGSCISTTAMGPAGASAHWGSYSVIER